MKKKVEQICECEECQKYRLLELSEQSMHAFIGRYGPNTECDLEDFEKDLEFTNKVYWDLCECGQERYSFYRDDDGNLLAWYDNIYELGFKLITLGIKASSTN